MGDERTLIYAPLRRAAFVGNAAMVNVLADLREGRFDPDTDPGGDLVAFLRALEIVDAGPEVRPDDGPRGDPRPTSVTLFLTTACNLRCTYCYAAAGDTPTRLMSLETAKRGIDFVSANALALGAPAFEVSFHGGGEPTVHWRVMTAAHEHARARAAAAGLGLRTYSATNGVLDDAQIDWMTAHLDGAAVSFDGLPEVHDRHRLTVLGRGSSERVLHTLRRFDETRFRYGVRVTVTADQIPRLADSIEFICAHFRPGSIQVEPAYRLGRWRGAPSAETEAFVAAYREAQPRARAHGREIRYSAARLGTLTNHFCGVTQDSFCLSPEGGVSACYEVFSEDDRQAPHFFYGEPSASGTGYTFRMPVLEHLRSQRASERDFCRGCFARWTCAGDCYHKSVSETGSLEFSGSERCHITRELTKDQILDRIAASGGHFWHGGGLEAPAAEGETG